ncbi:hypothetical protein CEK26_009830 [Fusarium fujikuroi]|uniref:Uncharacterized protein n=1 Tax=Fusarium fujikuroi TaxID=5127 RepID=A0A5Q3G0P6_FUSFU|nr:Uncharacterized protein Y057_13002 [Fusarium fujikuroi]QGI65879.1 hypothetical protein CEK27_009850 [Fusarium fujikuroi]QGI96761.1 hypothetical protein CEK26_009830 [Fusarium fujikuroi]VTT59737.1 unnamed protein product [Fusarium fujikuroi]VTT77370.1 unnamed protein product [Fusarium fujikuroi]
MPSYNNARQRRMLASFLLKLIQCTRKAPQEASHFNTAGSGSVPKLVVPSQGRLEIQLTMSSSEVLLSKVGRHLWRYSPVKLSDPSMRHGYCEFSVERDGIRQAGNCHITFIGVSAAHHLGVRTKHTRLSYSKLARGGNRVEELDYNARSNGKSGKADDLWVLLVTIDQLKILADEPKDGRHRQPLSKETAIRTTGVAESREITLRFLHRAGTKTQKEVLLFEPSR